MAPNSRQSALVAFGSLAKSLGAVRAGPLVRAAPALVSAISDGHRNVRASALAASAALVHGIGLHAVQLLPQLAPAILSVAASAFAAIAAESGVQSAAAVDSGGKGSQAVIKQKQCASEKGNDGCAKIEAASLEAAAALAAVLAILRTLPKFVSPYLPAILQHTLNPVVTALSQPPPKLSIQPGSSSACACHLAAFSVHHHAMPSSVQITVLHEEW